MQTILVYVLIPAGIYGVIALLALWPKFARNPRYRPGQPWSYQPVWWRAASSEVVPAPVGDQVEKTAQGGARGNW